MDTQTQRLQAVEKRLHNLEGHCSALAKQNRRLKIAGAVALALIGAFALIAAAAPKPKTVEAERFVLLDNQANERAVLAVRGNGRGEAALILFDKAGRDSVALTEQGLDITFENKAKASMTWRGLRLRDDEGNARVALDMLPLAAPGSFASRLVLYGPQGKAAAAGLYVSPDGTARMSLRDKDARLRMRLSVSKQGSPALWMYDANANTLFEAP